jgi:hypothetical protein
MPFARRGRPGLLRTVARTSVIAGTATATANAVDRRASTRAAQQQQAAATSTQQHDDSIPAPGQPEETSPARAGTDLVAQLSELARLRKDGLLTEAEFDAAKTRMLGL